MSSVMKVIANLLACGLISYLIIHSVVNYSSAINQYSNKWHDARCSVTRSAGDLYSKINYNAIINHTHMNGYINRTIPFKNKMYHNSPCKILMDYHQKIIDVKLYDPYHSSHYDNKANYDSMMQIIVFSVLLFAILMMLCLIITELNTISMIKRPDIEAPASLKRFQTGAGKHAKIPLTDKKEHDLRKAGIFYPAPDDQNDLHKAGIYHPSEFCSTDIKEKDISDYPPVYPTECIEKK